MNQYQEILSMTKHQLKGHFIGLYGWSMLSTLLITLLNSSTVFLKAGISSIVLSLLYSIICVFINTTVLFLFIQRVRGLRFRWQDIKYSFSKILVQVGIGILISFIQLCMQLFISMFMQVPFIYMILAIFLNLFFLCWYAFVAYMIYDQDTKIIDLLKKPLHIIKTNFSCIMIGGGCYVLWDFLAQVGLSKLFSTYISEYDTLENAFLSFIQNMSNHVNVSVMVIIVGIIFIIVQFIILVFLYTFLANVYEKEKILSR